MFIIKKNLFMKFFKINAEKKQKRFPFSLRANTFFFIIINSYWLNYADFGSYCFPYIGVIYAVFLLFVRLYRRVDGKHVFKYTDIFASGRTFYVIHSNLLLLNTFRVVIIQYFVIKWCSPCVLISTQVFQRNTNFWVVNLNAVFFLSSFYEFAIYRFVFRLS